MHTHSHGQKLRSRTRSDPEQATLDLSFNCYVESEEHPVVDWSWFIFRFCTLVKHSQSGKDGQDAAKARLMVLCLLGDAGMRGLLSILTLSYVWTQPSKWFPHVVWPFCLRWISIKWHDTDREVHMECNLILISYIFYHIEGTNIT